MNFPDVAPQTAVDNAARALLDLLHAMARLERARPEPAKWDDEYAAHAVNDCIDRLFCAPDAGMPKPSPIYGDRYHAVYEEARPFLEEGFPLPGSLEEDVAAREERIWAERWPELQDQDRRLHPELTAAIHFEALRDAQAARA